DFNMALYRVAGEARRRGLHVSLAASYAWRVTASDDVRYDSCGLFVVGPIRKTAPLLRPLPRAETTPAAVGASRPSPAALAEPPAVAGTDSLPEHISGQGYNLPSYLGGEKSLRESLQLVHLSGAMQHTDHWPVLPACKEKRIDVHKWDQDQCLFRAGGHFPLLVFFGERARRTEGAMIRREEASSARG
ncbi:MAG: hypothetical protein GY772_09345, partial [bacterium]|nr:hypothetical protein [bacterium]